MLGFYQSLADVEKGNTQLQLALAILSHIRGQEWWWCVGAGGSEALVKFTGQRHRHTRRLTLITGV